MAYSEKAKELRRCVATTKQGGPCRSFALWDHPGGLGASHGRHHRGPMGPGLAPKKRTNYQPCVCTGYGWPHRPGSGRYCLWPDPPPAECPTPAHTTRTPRSKRNAQQRLERFLRRAGA
jgi:hypothetical protein